MGGKGSGKRENLGEHLGKVNKPRGATNRLSKAAIRAAMKTGELPAAGLLRIFRVYLARADLLLR